MSKPLGYFFLSGALGVGGTAASAYLFRLGLQESALQLQLRKSGHVARILRGEIDLAELYDEARARGIDPERVSQALLETRSTLGEILARLPLPE